MRILILSNHDLGLYRFRKELIHTLLKSDEVSVAVPYGNYVPVLEEMGCNYIKTELDRHGRSPISDLKLLYFYIKIIRKIKPDSVLTYTIKPNIYGGIAAKWNLVPYIANITGLGSAMAEKGVLQRMLILLYRYSLSSAQTVFFQNNENDALFKQYSIANGKHKLIPGSGVNLDEFLPLPFPDKRIIEFAFIARVMKEKGIEQFLEAASVVKKKYPNTNFHVCGYCEESYEDRLRIMEEENIIFYHGVVEDMTEIYNRIQCTVLPTYYPEGMSNVLLESAACARPVITTSQSGCREIIEDGRNGFICREKDSDDLVNQLEKFINLPWETRRQMGLYGRRKVETEFDRKIVIHAYRMEIEESRTK